MGPTTEAAAFFISADGSPMEGIVEAAERLAPCDTGLLLLGEMGTGKERLATSIHRSSGRSGPLVPVRCGCLAEPLLVQHLFGTVFPKTTEGLFATASGGTLLLEDADRLSNAVQAMLVSSLRRVTVVGPSRFLGSVRIIATSSRDIPSQVEAGTFRRDLRNYFACSIELPPLRSRPKDALAIFSRLWEKRGGGREVAAQAMDVIQRYPWPGNVSELDSFTSRLALLTDARKITDLDVTRQLLRYGERTDAGPVPFVPSSNGCAMNPRLLGATRANEYIYRLGVSDRRRGQ